MKRLFASLAVVILASAWTGSARAQYGLGGFGATPDMSAEIETQRNALKSQMGKYTKAPRAPSGIAGRARPTNPAMVDRYGRMDLAGHPVAGYPAVRGDLNASGVRVSRGGANGRHGRPGAAAHRRQAY
jgi:hypothetical protein